jgi:hypothetical protein
LEKEIGPFTEKHKQLVTILEFARVEAFIRTYWGCVGRPAEDRPALARAFLAKAVYNFPKTTHLIDRLHCDPVLRRICGWLNRSSIPSTSTFSRAFAEFAASGLASRAHEKFILQYHSERLIGHVSRDATEIEGREKAVRAFIPKALPKRGKKKRGRPKKGEKRPAPPLKRLERQLKMSLPEMLADLPKACDIGTKKNSKGFKVSWKGYKLHIDTADGDIPISALLTSASLHDSQVSIPLATQTAKRVQNCYDLMDAAYDAEIIRAHSTSLGHVPLIDFNHRSPKDERTFAPHEAARYKQRSSAERVNSNLKDNFGGRFVAVKGHTKVFAHLMFGVLALAIHQTVRLLT